MNNSKNAQNLKKSLGQLEKTAQQIVNTRGYTKDVENIKILSEMIREQLINENSVNTARKIR
jgi:hypothetical protein